MSVSADPYLLASTILTPDELPKLVLVTYDASAHPHDEHAGGSTPLPVHTQRIFAIVSNISFGVEQSCVLVIKPRRKDPKTASLLSVIPVLPDLKIEIEPQQGLTASVASLRNHPSAATTLGLYSLPQSLPTIHTLLESVVPDLFAPPDKAGTSNAALRFTLSHAGQSASGITSDVRGLKDFLSVLKDLLKVAQDHSFSSDTTHQWMTAYTEDLHPHPHHSLQHHQHGRHQLDTPIFSRFSQSAFLPSSSAPPSQLRPASPTADDIRISVGTFNVNSHLPQDDIPGIIGLKKWLRAEQDPDLIVLGFQEVDNSGGAYLYYSPAREDAWTRAISQALGRRADKYRKITSKQLVGLMILVFVRTELEGMISEVAAASVGVGLGGFVANKGAVAVRMKVGERTICFVNSHLSAFEGLQAMERRCWDWNEIYKRLRLRLQLPQMEDFWETPAKPVDAKTTRANDRNGLGDLKKEQSTSTPNTAQDVQEEAAFDDLNFQDARNNTQAHLTGEEEVKPTMATSLNGQSKNDSNVRVDSVALSSEASTPDIASDWRPAPEPSSDDLSTGSTSTHIDHPIMDHDIVIHFGDLNFRLDLSHSEAHRLIRQRQYDLLYRYDQLESLRTSGSLFDDFEEGDIRFAPTYKFDKGTDRYDTSEKQRVPAWTDRILWAVTKEWEDVDESQIGSATGEEQRETKEEGEGKERQRQRQRKQGVMLQSYESVSDLKFSDHRPVRATFLVRIR